MQLTYDEIQPVGVANEDLNLEDTRNIPFLGFITGSLISFGLWCVIAWVVWVAVY